jgi:hypothetical protein
MVSCITDLLSNTGHPTAMSEEAIEYVPKTVSGFLCLDIPHPLKK